jgi:hypothetical protein
MFGALIRAAESWRGLRFTEFELRQLDVVRKDLDAEYEASITRSTGHLGREFPAIPRLDREPRSGGWDIVRIEHAVLLAVGFFPIDPVVGAVGCNFKGLVQQSVQPAFFWPVCAILQTPRALPTKGK